MQTASHPHELEATVAGLLTSRRFPKQWYQQDGITIVFAVMITLLGYLSVFIFRLHPPFALSLISVLILFLGVIADRVTTHRVFLVKQKYDIKGLEFRIREANPLLSPTPSAQEIILGGVNWLVLIAMGIAFFVPFAGLGIATALFAVSLNNHRNRQQALYELELFEQLKR